MKKLIQAISNRIIALIKHQASNLEGGAAELRANFNGPPEVVLRGVFEELAKDGGIEVTLRSGEVVTIPVVMQVENLPEGFKNPPIGKSGLCLENYLMDLRNSTNCPRFVGMLSPGNHPSLSHKTTRSDFGLSAHANSGAANISEWWSDPFIQGLVDDGLARHAWDKSDERDDARRLVEHAIFAADSFERHNVSRHGAWMVLSRIWAIENKGIPFGDLLSLACGYPSLGGEGIDYEVQHGVLGEISDRVEDKSFRPAFEEFKAKARDEDDANALENALDALLHHLQSRCNVPSALGRAAPYYYGPFIDGEFGEPPYWWKILTVEVWQKLLDGEGTEPRKAIQLECLDVITPQVKGMTPVVAGPIRLRISLPEGTSPDTVIKVVRHSSGPKNHKEWVLQGQESMELIDPDPPSHRVPIRYVAEGGNLKPGSIKVVSMGAWQPGVFICSRTASKVSAPKHAKSSREKVDFESSLTLNGEGRHYIDVFVRPGVNVGESAFFSGDDELSESRESTVVSRVSDDEYGFEADARGDCFYQLNLSDPEEEGDESNKALRIYISCSEVSPEECGSEFERLIRLNRQRDGGRATMDVSVDRKLRCTDLQSWMLDESQIRYSYYPLVLGPDYSQQWRSRNWNSEADTIVSQGRFPSDPRPRLHEMEPPIKFIECRFAIAKRIRDDDGNGLFESAKLGEWIVTDKEFAELIEQYVRSYLDWLDADRASAAWCDLSIVTAFEADGTTLVQEPDAILVSPLHPIRIAWHAVAQSALFLAQKKLPCPAASVLDPDCIIDAIALPMRSPSGGLKEQVFFSVECSSDYWAILWNASRLGQIMNWAGRPPFDREFGIQVGGISSGFSVSQVHRALDEISEMLMAKPVLNILVSSAAGQNNSCNEGLLSWCRENFSQAEEDQPSFKSLGHRLIQILDERKADARPEDAEISNLADDTQNAVRWFDRGVAGITPDLGIVAQLETTGATHDETKIGSALGFGGLIRHRVRQQLKGGAGAFLRESRMGVACPPSGDGLADKTVSAIVKLENLSDAKYGYMFAPSVPSIQALLDKADFVAVSSAAVDPACFLGGWLERAYLWDYELPSYSGRAGDSNGYYLLSKIKEVDQETLATVLSRLPNCADLPESLKEEVILEVARRGIPTVRGLSSGDSGASGDLGLFIAARLLQNEFSTSPHEPSLFPVVAEANGVTQIVLVIPVDPFRGYLDDLTRAIKKTSNQRPDLLVASICISESRINCKITPVEVKFRGAKEPMSAQASLDALSQAQSLSGLLEALKEKSNDQELALWRVAFQHLLTSILVFGLRVYSQQEAILRQADRWAAHHARLVEAIFSGSFSPEIDLSGRLIVIDGTSVSGIRDVDGDGFAETMVLSHKDASLIVKGEAKEVYKAIRARVVDWRLLPGQSKEDGIAVKDAPKNEGKSTDSATLTGRQEDSAAHQGVETSHKNKGGALSDPETTETGDRTTQTKTAEGDIAGVNLLIGRTVDGFDVQMRQLNLSDTNLNQLNIGVVGDLGTGKTQLLKSLVYQITKSAESNQGVKPRILIFDYKKDYSSTEFVTAVGAKVVKPYHLPINLFDLAGAGDSTAPWLDRFKFFADVLDKIFSGVGPVQRAKLKKAVRKSYDDCEIEGRQPTIYDVHANYQAILGNSSDAPMAIIDDLVDMEMFSPTPTDAAGFDDFLDGVVVVSLDSLGQDDRTKNMLVAIMLNMFYEHMLRIPKRPYYGENKDRRVVDSFLLVDEADNIMRYEFDVLRKILLQGREFGVGVILASQYLKHFKSGATDYREPLLTWFIHKVPNITPQELGALGLIGDVTNLADRVKSLALHECLFKTFDVPGEIVKGVPFYKLKDYGK